MPAQAPLGRAGDPPRLLSGRALMAPELLHSVYGAESNGQGEVGVHGAVGKAGGGGQLGVLVPQGLLTAICRSRRRSRADGSVRSPRVLVADIDAEVLDGVARLPSAMPRQPLDRGTPRPE